LTLRQLAEQASVTAAYLSRLENEKVSPSINTLRKIADCLKVSMIRFFENDLVDDPCINPPDTWTPKLIHGWNADVRQMVRTTGNKKMQPLFSTIPPNGMIPCPEAGSSEELVYVLAGRLTLRLDGDTTELTPGTLAYFSAKRPHAWINNTGEPCTFMLVCSPPDR